MTERRTSACGVDRSHPDLIKRDRAVGVGTCVKERLGELPEA